ncbi:MAG: ABC transporter permease subunit [Planctomycetota bacterium]
MLKQFFAISRNTFLEAVRQPIFVVLILVGTLLMLLNPFFAAYSMEPGEGDNRMLVDLGLGTLFLAGMFLAAFTATGVVASEMESRTALTVVSKPVPRPIFILGKFVGVAGAIASALYILLLVLLLTVRHRVMQNASDQLDGPVIVFSILAVVGALAIAAAANYLYRRVFTSMFTGMLAGLLTVAFLFVLMVAPDWSFQPLMHDLAERDYQMVQIMIAGFLIAQGVMLLAAIAVALSTRLSQVATLLACLVVLVLGLVAGAISQHINQRLNLDPLAPTFQTIQPILNSGEPFLQKALYLAGKALYAILPNFQFHWPSDAISLESSLIHDEHGEFSLSYLSAISLYTAAYTTAILALGVALFQKREVN